MNQEKLVFVSCGQSTDEENSLGAAVADLVDNRSGFRAYRAAQVHDLDGLSDNIFEALRNCSGMVAILHSRGEVVTPLFQKRTTTSIWIQQEIAALAYRRAAEGVPIPIRVFQKEDVQLGGAMTSMIANPVEFRTQNEVLVEVKHWLSSEHFRSPVERAEFQSMVAALEDDDWHVIEAVFAGGGSHVKKAQIKAHLRTKCLFVKNKASRVLTEAVQRFANSNLIVLMSQIRAPDELSVNPVWKFELRRELNRRTAQRP